MLEIGIMPKGLSFKNLGDNEAEISITGEIGGWFGQDPDYFRNQVKGLAGRTLNVHINSPGGDILAGNEMFNALKEHDGTVNINIGALCASMATVLACSGDHVTIAKNSLYMIHNPFVCIEGDAEQMRKMADVMDKMKANIIDAYAEKTGISKADLSEMMDAETWMDAEECISKGFADAIENDESESAEDVAANAFTSGRFSNLKGFLKISNKLLAQAALATGGAGSQSSQSSNTASGKQPNTKPNTDQMSIPNEADVAALAEQKANAMFKAKLESDAEIDKAVLAIRTRDNRDWSHVAAEIKQNPGKSVTDFYAAISTRQDFKPVGVIGSGAENVEVVGVWGLEKGSPGEMFIATEEFKAMSDKFKRGSRPQGALSITLDGSRGMHGFRNADQTSSATSGNGLTSIEKLPGVVQLGVRPLLVKDLLAPGATNNTTVRYIQEVSYTQAAGAVAEDALLPNVAVTYNEIDAPVKDIGGYIKASDNLMSDYLSVASFINARLPYQVERATEDELLNGAGNGVHLTGILNQTGVQTYAKGTVSGTETNADAIHRAITKVRWQNMSTNQAQGGFEPDAIILHPTDWETLRLAKDGAGQYYSGGPFTAAYGNGAMIQMQSIWGKMVVVTPAIAQGSALVGAFRLGAQFFQRQGLTIEMTNTDQDDFVNRRTTIRAAERLALAVYLPGSFCLVAGIA
jgi:HK97 family phage major capsid protein